MGLIQDGIIGQDQHWELLPTAAAMCVTVGHHVRGFQPFPNFPAVSSLYIIIYSTLILLCFKYTTFNIL
jgi:hypothetical protein